jgi:dihydrofolate synthase/folylpolyglutamate synthase
LSYTDLIREAQEAVVKIRSIKEAEAALLPYVPLVSQLSGKDTTLDRIRPLMDLLGNPQDQLKVIHIAGTSGKTSTAYYMSALLSAAGKKTGLTVSPHVDSITERVQINGKPMPEADFYRELGTFLEVIKRAGQRPSYFELLYAFALWTLARQNVDYAVVETGVGGLYDATNIASRPDKVCIITDIGFDHTHLLGNTLSEIASQKIGIVHSQNHVFTYRQPDEAMEVIEQWTGDYQAYLHVIDEEAASAPDTMPAYQQRNWQLAYAAYEYLAERDKLQHLTSQVLGKTRQIRIPGRMEIKRLNGKTIVMDGAHNAQKMAAFIDSFKRLYPDVKPAVLLALKTGKEYEELAPLFISWASRVIVTTFDTSQDLPVKSTDPEILAEAFRSAGVANVESIPGHQAAFQALLAVPDKVCIITGSFYLLSQIRNNEHLV